MDFPELSRYPYFAFDTEGTGLRYKVDWTYGLSVSTPDDRDFYWDLRKTPRAVEWWNDQMKNYGGIAVAHNVSYDYRFMHQAGFRTPIEALDDTVIRACLIDEHLFSYELDELGRLYLGMAKDSPWSELALMFGGAATKKVQIKNMVHAPIELAARYAKRDSRIALNLWEWQEQEIERQGIHAITSWERSLMPRFIRAEMRGVPVDVDQAERAQEQITPILNQAQKELNDIAGFDLNVNSPTQIKKLFDPRQDEHGDWYTKYGDQIGTTPKGGPSITGEYLREMDHPAAKLIVDVRSMIRTRDTFLAKHILEHNVDGIVYPNINQNKGEDGGTGTGRLSYTDPALQQIPSRNKQVAKIVKACFVPPPGHVWLASDKASFEVRVFAHLVNNPTIVQAYHKDPNLDFHQFVADLTNLVRNAEYSGQANAKQLNLSMIFNSGDGAIADKMGMPWHWDSFIPRGGSEKDRIRYKKPGPEAAAVIAKYHRRVQGVKELAEGCKKTAARRGYIFTSRGRRLRFPNKRFCYKASGLLIQATSADYNKENWEIIEETLDGEGHLILNTHDDYNLALPEDNWEKPAERVKRAIERPGRARVPLILEIKGVGTNWWDAVKKED